MPLVSSSPPLSSSHAQYEESSSICLLPYCEVLGAAGRTPEAISAGWTSPAASAHRPSDPDPDPPGGCPLHIPFISVFLVLGGPWGWTHCCRCGLTSTAQRDNPSPPSTGHAFIDPSQAAASSFYCQGTLLAHAQLTVCQHPRAFSIELLSSQFFIIYLPTLTECNIPTYKQTYCVAIVLFVVKTENRAGNHEFVTFSQFNFVLHYK